MTIRAQGTFDDWVKEQMTGPEFRDAFEAAGVTLSLGIRIRELRLANGLSKRELAKRARVPKATISRIELGDPDLGIETVTKLSKALGTRLIVELVPEKTA